MTAILERYEYKDATIIIRASVRGIRFEIHTSNKAYKPARVFDDISSAKYEAEIYVETHDLRGSGTSTTRSFIY